MRQLFTIRFIPLLLFFLLASSMVDAQKISPRWQASLRGGPTLFWGDVSVNEDEGDYLAKFKDDNQWSFGASLGYRIVPFATLGADVSYGQLEGIRDKYPAGSLLNQTFETQYIDYALTLRLNINDLIGGYNNNRLFSVYLLGGYGQVHYRAKTTQLTSGAYLNSVGYSNNGQTKESMVSAARIPIGGGLQFSLNDHFNANIETYVNRTNVDNMDAQAGNTDVNDMYTFTTVGITYKFGLKKERKPQIEPEPEPEPEPVIAEEPVDVDVVIDFPDKLSADTLVNLTYRIEKEDLEEGARFQQTLPMGVKVVSGKAPGAEFSFNDQIMSFEWDKLPKAETVTIRVQMRVGAIASGDYTVPGIFFYDENGEEKQEEFSSFFNVRKPVVIAKEPEPEPKPEPKPAVVYRVQVRAIYNGKQSPEKVKETYNIKKPVYEHFHKGYAKYSAGDFDTYADANEYKRKLRSDNGIGDAFVVAFYNDERLNSVADATKVQASKTAASETKSGTYYKVQIAAVSAKNEQVPPSVFATKYNLVNQQIEVEQSGAWYRYTIGSYSSYTDAKRKLAEIKSNVPDAFIAKYVDGKRM